MNESVELAAAEHKHPGAERLLQEEPDMLIWTHVYCAASSSASNNNTWNSV